jgi:hypothetical protein
MILQTLRKAIGLLLLSVGALLVGLFVGTLEIALH